MAPAPLTDFSTLITKICHDPCGANWRTEWQHACELLWSLQGQELSVQEEEMAVFVELIQRKERFALARLVIPALRSDSDHGLTYQQQLLMAACQQTRKALLEEEGIVQGDYDDPTYVQEKRILQNAELHRVKVLFHTSGAFQSTHAQQIQNWLDQCPW